VTFEDCTVHGDWGGDHTYKPRWWKTALRLKSDRHTNGTLQNIQYLPLENSDFSPESLLRICPCIYNHKFLGAGTRTFGASALICSSIFRCGIRARTSPAWRTIASAAAWHTQRLSQGSAHTSATSPWLTSPHQQGPTAHGGQVSTSHQHAKHTRLAMH